VNDVDSVEQKIMDLEKQIEDNRTFKICLLNKIKTLSNSQTTQFSNNDLYINSLTDVDFKDDTEIRFNTIKYKMQEEWLLLENLQFVLYKQLELENKKIEKLLEKMLNTDIVQNDGISNEYNKGLYKLKEIMKNINRIYQIIF
jgi:hypothetical protein